VSDIKVPEIKIPKVEIPQTPFINEHVLTGIIPGCNLYHRDLQITKNPSILYNDRKAFITCPEGEMPSFNSIEYDSQQLIKTVAPSSSIPQAVYKPVVVNKPKKKVQEIEPPPCPDLSRVLPVGSFTTDLRTQRIIAYKRGDNGVDCFPILEEVTFVKSVLPTTSAALNVVTISLLAASSPAILAILKSLSKTVFKKAISRSQKSKNVDEVKPD
tara:strand:+ start:157 stop:798 length:642 start_codon:yes stop_codon:yes gene_type:complete